jgi:acyl-CoA synthetase (AMP-forming)/AMP-acid ligase II
MTHFSVDAALEQLVTEAPTVLYPSFPTLTSSVLDHPRWSEVDVDRVRVVNNVAPPDTLRKFQAAYPNAVQVAAYGLSEACGVIAHNLLTDDLETRVTTCGKPFPGIEVKVVDPETHETLPPDEQGEIWIRGYCLFEGYHNDPEKTAETITDDGWLRTGDLCSLDAEGSIRYHGRIKDMLKVGGENVAAIEIESFLSNHPAIKLAQVVGMPDERLDEVPVAFVELSAGKAATEQEIIDFCQGQIASFKVPRRVLFVEEWPMSTTKIQKFRLRRMLLEAEG